MPFSLQVLPAPSISIAATCALSLAKQLSRLYGFDITQCAHGCYLEKAHLDNVRGKMGDRGVACCFESRCSPGDGLDCASRSKQNRISGLVRSAAGCRCTRWMHLCHTKQMQRVSCGSSGRCKHLLVMSSGEPTQSMANVLWGKINSFSQLEINLLKRPQQVYSAFPEIFVPMSRDFEFVATLSSIYPWTYLSWPVSTKYSCTDLDTCTLWFCFLSLSELMKNGVHMPCVKPVTCGRA